MQIWHATPDAPRTPQRVSPGDRVSLTIGTWPVEPGQAVWVDVEVMHADRVAARFRTTAMWQRNVGPNSYWHAELPPFERGDHVTYHIAGHSPAGAAAGPREEFQVGPKLYLALLWHHHQPLYRDPAVTTSRGRYARPSVRLHAIRDYYAMAALVAQHPRVHVTINLTPVLLAQIEDYVEHGATDRALELTRIPAERLNRAEVDEIRRTFFDATPETQIQPHPRYAELFAQARRGTLLAAQDLRDLQMWANLAWFAKEFRNSAVSLITGDVVSVERFVRQEHGYAVSDIEAMITEQSKILRAIIPIHRTLQERGQIEVSTSPYYHPILPLLIDSDRATLDRLDATLPPRFAYPEDADAQIRLAVEAYDHRFGRAPRGMWPPEGAVSQDVIPLFARYGVQWIAIDSRVLAHSGSSGYRVDDPDVVCQPYRARDGEHTVAVFFREGWLADDIGFRYCRYADYDQAARELLTHLECQYTRRIAGSGDRVITIALDGENPWGAYRDDGRPFLHALYRALEANVEIETVTFAEYLAGNPARGLGPHSPEGLAPVVPLYPGSWADEAGSAPGVDFGTSLGELEENAAWALLGEVRSRLAASGATPDTNPDAFHAMYAAEGSDWLWWLGTDQESARDIELDALFHGHLERVYEALGEAAPPHITPHTRPPTVVWSPTVRPSSLAPGGRLLVRADRPRALWYAVDGSSFVRVPLVCVRSSEDAVPRYQRLLGPFPPGVREVRFRVELGTVPQNAGPAPESEAEHIVRIAEPRAALPSGGGEPDRH